MMAQPSDARMDAALWKKGREVSRRAKERARAWGGGGCCVCWGEGRVGRARGLEMEGRVVRGAADGGI